MKESCFGDSSGRYERLSESKDNSSPSRPKHFPYIAPFYSKASEEVRPLLEEKESGDTYTGKRLIGSDEEKSIYGKGKNEIASEEDTTRIITFQIAEDFDRLLSGGLTALYKNFKTPYSVLQMYQPFVEEIKAFLEQKNLDPDTLHVNENGQLIHVVERQEEVKDEQILVDGGIKDDVKLMECFDKKSFIDVIREMTNTDAGPEERENFKLLVDRTTVYLKKLWGILEENTLKLRSEIESKYLSEGEEKRIAFEYYKMQAKKSIALNSPCKMINYLRYHLSWQYKVESRRYKRLVTEDFRKQKEMLDILQKKYGNQIYGFGKSKNRQEELYKEIVIKEDREKTDASEYRSLTAKCLAQLSMDIKVYKVLRANYDKLIEAINSENAKKQEECQKRIECHEEILENIKDENGVKEAQEDFKVLKEHFYACLSTQNEVRSNKADELMLQFSLQLQEAFKSMLTYEASEGACSDIARQSANLQMQNKLNEIRQIKIRKMLGSGNFDVITNNAVNAASILLGAGGLSLSLLSTIHTPAATAAAIGATIAGGLIATGIAGATAVR
jgi:hypothetical protein